MVVVHHVIAVVFKRVRACALVQDGAHLRVLEVACRERLAELGLIHVVGVVSSPQIQELRAGEIRCRRKVIDDENVTLADAIQLLNEIAADKAGAAGNDDQRCVS